MSDYKPFNTEKNFSYSHLPAALQEVSKPFCELGLLMAETLPDGYEKQKALDHLLYAKDAAVRAKFQ